jgi:cation:H+ antiporter
MISPLLNCAMKVYEYSRKDINGGGIKGRPMEDPSLLTALVSASIISAFAVFVVSLMLLYRSSEWFTEGSVKLASRIGVSKFIIGVVIAGFGTSLPELATSVYAAFAGSSGVAVGNAVGSNITNIALVLGLACLVGSVKVRRDIELREGLIALFIMFFASIFLIHNRDLVRQEGLLFIAVFVAYLFWALKNPINHRDPRSQGKLSRSIIGIMGGLGGVLLGSALLVSSAVAIARFLGVPEAVIGLTMVAVGTSLPELAVALVAAKKGYPTIVLGNIIGSNIMNMLLVLGAASIVAPLTVGPEIFGMALPMMLFLSFLLVIFMRAWEELRWEKGVLFLGLYAFFLWLSFT